MKNQGNIKDISDHPYTLRIMAILFIALNFGIAFNIRGVNISNYCAVIFLLVYIREIRYIRVSNWVDKRVITIFILWLLYALCQFVIVNDRSLFISFYIILLLNLNYSRQYNHFGYIAKECDNLTLDS